MPEVVLVDHADTAIGTAEKASVHEGLGSLHRAFSLFLTDARGRLLVQKRAAAKPLWPGYWANSCCSHPEPDEAIEDAARRRAVEELGLEIAVPLKALFGFEYHARFGEIGAEHEFCHVLWGQLDQEAPKVRLVAEEVEAFGWLGPAEVDALVASEEEGERAAPWFKMEWKRLRRFHPDLFDSGHEVGA